MAVVETVEKNVVNMRLNVGQDGSGNTIYKNVSLGTLSISPSDWDDQKILNIAGALAPCLTHTLSTVVRTRTSTLEES